MEILARSSFKMIIETYFLYNYDFKVKSYNKKRELKCISIIERYRYDLKKDIIGESKQLIHGIGKPQFKSPYLALLITNNYRSQVKHVICFKKTFIMYVSCVVKLHFTLFGMQLVHSEIINPKQFYIRLHFIRVLFQLHCPVMIVYPVL